MTCEDRVFEKMMFGVKICQKAVVVVVVPSAYLYSQELEP